MYYFAMSRAITPEDEVYDYYAWGENADEVAYAALEACTNCEYPSEYRGVSGPVELDQLPAPATEYGVFIK